MKMYSTVTFSVVYSVLESILTGDICRNVATVRILSIQLFLISYHEGFADSI